MKLASLTPDSRNANKGTDRGRKMVRESLKRYGAGRSILIDKNGAIIAGNKTAEGAKAVGMDDVQVVKSDGSKLIAVQRTDLDINDKAARELAIADNRASEVGLEWDLDALKALETEVDVDLSPFFDERELVQFWANSGDGEAPEPKLDQAAELQRKWGTQSGQLWLIGPHRLLCGDVFGDLSHLMNGRMAQLVVTSPPYNQGLDRFKPSGMHTETNWVANVQAGSYSDSKPEDQYQTEQAKMLQCLAGRLDSTASVFYNHKNRYRGKQVVSPWRWIEESGAKVRQEIIWKREGSVTQNARMFLPCDERIFWLYFGDDFYFNDSTENKTFSSVWEINSHKDIGHSEHGCAYPLELAARPIQSCSRRGDVVIDPYLGSGTTMCAAQLLKRICYGIELEPKYVAVALERLSDMGLTPKLADA